MTWIPRRAFSLLFGCLVLLPPAEVRAEVRAEVLGQAASVALGSAPVRVTFGGGAAVATRVRALRPGQKIWLVVRRLRASGPPGVLYSLFLDLDAGAVRPGESDPRSVGTINFYAAVPPNDTAPTVSFDITKNLVALVAKTGLRNEMSVTIVPTAPPAPDAGAVLGSVELVVE